MDFEGDSGRRNNDVLNAVDVLKDPLISRVIRTSIAEEHAVQPIHEIVSTEQETQMVRGGGVQCVSV